MALSPHRRTVLNALRKLEAEGDPVEAKLAKSIHLFFYFATMGRWACAHEALTEVRWALPANVYDARERLRAHAREDFMRRGLVAIDGGLAAPASNDAQEG